MSCVHRAVPTECLQNMRFVNDALGVSVNPTVMVGHFKTFKDSVFFSFTPLSAKHIVSMKFQDTFPLSHFFMLFMF